MTQKWFFRFICIMAVLTSGCSKSENTNQKFDYYPVIKKDLVEYIEANASVEIENAIEINAPTRGRLEKLFIEEGDKIKKDQKVGYMSSDTRIHLLEMAAHKGPEEIEYWEKQILPTYIFAPSDGVVIEIDHRPGDTISGDIAKISAGEIIRANIDEIDIYKITKGQKVDLVFEVFSDQKFTGAIKRISAVSKKVSNVNVYEIDISLPEDKVFEKAGFSPKIGMSVTVQIPIETIENTNAVKLVAVNNQFQQKVSVTLKDGNKEKIELGKAYGEYVHILSGITEGDEIRVPTFTAPNEKKKKNSFNLLKQP